MTRLEEYRALVASKQIASHAVGIIDPTPITDLAFHFQRDITRWALKRGKAAIFAGCGTGKTLMQLEWARHVSEYTGKPVLILAPLAVAQQTVREGAKFGIDATYSRDGSVAPGITITNYEMLEHFDATAYGGVVIDESSILKAYDGKTRTAIIDAFRLTPFRLACTATPAPNDFMELGNHAEFLGVMSRTEMLATFFVHDGGETQTWRLKGHAEEEFWRWVCSWAVTLRAPSDLGYSDDGFILPPLEIVEHVAPVDHSEAHAAGMLFAPQALTLNEQRAVRRATLVKRMELAAQLANESVTEPFLLWCELNDEGDALEKAIPDAVQIRGADSNDEKEEKLTGFIDGRYRVLITKDSMTGFGLNLQHCARQIFVGPSHSFERTYQAIRRCWRFGQTRPVVVHMIRSETDEAIVANLKRKEADAERMAESMVAHVRAAQEFEIHGTARITIAHDPLMEMTTPPWLSNGDDRHDETPVHCVIAQKINDDFAIYHGDCVEGALALPNDSIDYTIFSPPFGSLYVYSNSLHDMGNVANDEEFFGHFNFLVPELLRVTKPGRLLSFHCMNLPTSKTRDGVIGLKDFRGNLIRMFCGSETETLHEARKILVRLGRDTTEIDEAMTDASLRNGGWIYHSEVCIWKDPVTAMQRTKAIGLLHKQLKKDSCLSRQGIPDYFVTMRKPGENASRVSHTNESFPVREWQGIASPVWMDINPSDTLQFRSAREDKDERHICPLQLEVIRRGLRLWSNPGDIVLSPFAGIGSDGVVALQEGRRFVGFELKESYYKQAVKNLRGALGGHMELFAVEVDDETDESMTEKASVEA